ncbi:MAG: FkbM family methyltransferase [Pseudomonadota bacterium]
MSKELDLLSDFGTQSPDVLSRLVWKLATHRFLSSDRRRRIRKSLAARFSGPFDLRIDDIFMRAYPMENYCDRIAIGRGHLPESAERGLIGPLLKPGMVFVDIGANVGTYSLFVAQRCQDSATIISFEPHPRTFAKLSYNIRANGFSAIEAVNQGVGPQAGRMVLHSSGGSNIGTASLLPQAAGDKHQVEIKVGLLSHALKSRMIGQVDLLKIDIEGFEDRALLPLMTDEHVALWPKALLIETALKEHWQTDCVAELLARGYTNAGQTGENILLLHPEAKGRSEP